MKTIARCLACLAILFCSLPSHAAPKVMDSKGETSGPTIAVFRLTGELTESPVDNSFPLFATETESLKEMTERMHKAETDENVKAVVVLCEGFQVGFGQIEELRNAVQKIRDAGKDVYAHSDSATMPNYVMLSGATRLSMAPTADLWVTGLHAEQPYVRQLLDKIGVKPDFLHCGDYKSASELLMRDGPSPEAEKMMNWLLDGMYGTAVDLIAKGRKVDAEKVHKWIDDGPYTASAAKAAGLIDEIEQRQDFASVLKKKYGESITFDRRYGKKKQPKLDFSSPFAMFQIWAELLAGPQKKSSNKPVVGIVYVDGPIVLGKNEPGLFGSGVAASTDIRKALDEAADDASIKAVVLRIDSPGGSATASEIILDATRRLKAKKPLIVSMGNVAGSGGYYVACASDTIIADESTLTGSIGVVGGKLATNEMWKKIGITWHSYNRGANANILASDDVFTPTQREKMQKWMDEIYGVFKEHVTTNRGDKLKKPIDELAGGRVYTGKQALELGLIDKIGTLQDAVVDASQKAKLTDYDVRIVPEPKNFIEKIMEQAGGDEDADKVSLNSGDSLLKLAAPYLAGLDPHRAAAIKSALLRVQMIQQEGVIVAMPEMSIGQ
jgi:protease-4